MNPGWLAFSVIVVLELLQFVERRRVARDIHLQLNEQEEKFMAQFDDITALIAAVDAKTNEMAAEEDAIQAEIAKLQAAIVPGLTTDQATAIQAGIQAQLDKLSAQSDRLKSLGADPVNPVPTPAP